MHSNGKSKKRNEMREKIKNILSNSYTKQGEFNEYKALNELCVLLDVSKNKPLPPPPPKDREIHISGKSRYKK